MDFDVAGNCRSYVTTMKAKNFQYDIPSPPIANSKDHYVQVFYSPSMQNTAENVITSK